MDAEQRDTSYYRWAPKKLDAPTDRPRPELAWTYFRSFDPQNTSSIAIELRWDLAQVCLQIQPGIVFQVPCGRKYSTTFVAHRFRIVR